MNEIAYEVAMEGKPFPGCLTPFGRRWAPHAGQPVLGPHVAFWGTHGRALHRAWTRWKADQRR
jgi:hypothetical protein